MPQPPVTGRTRVKICGITRPEDGRDAALLGADAVGLVFYAPSPRYVTPSRARAIVDALPPFTTVVGLFFDAPPREVSTVLEEVAIDLLQFHGAESPEYCAGFDRPYIKAMRVRAGMDLHGAAAQYENAKALLLDHYQEGVAGGTGKTFDWSWLPADLRGPIILAGGLTPENVAAAIRAVRPYAVDVSSGVEVTKGVKDRAKIGAFLRSVNDAQTS